ncbi:MAG: GDP-mannose 4,6-dehydratase [Phototrophicaceae bacterium]
MANKEKRALITGGAGFIGNHLARSLLGQGYHVTVIDDLSTGLFANVADMESDPNFRLYVDTIRNESLMEKLMEESYFVYHLASAVGVRLIMERPVYTIDNIYQGTEIVLRFARRYRNRVLITSTSEVYGKSDKIPFVEDGDRLEGSTTRHRWAYACAKALDEFLAMAHWKETRLPVTIVRLFNTVGPRQRSQYGMVLPRFVSWALAGETIQVHGDGQQSRCFGHVYDVIDGLVGLMESEASAGQVFNLGSDEEISIGGLAQRVIERLDSDSKVRHIPYEEVYGEGFEDMQRRVPSIAKVKATIGWQPQRDLNVIIDDIAAYLREARGEIV